MSKDRSWMTRRIHDGFLSSKFEGVNEFLDFAFSHEECVDEGKIKCPCASCALTCYETRDIVNLHIFRKGFVRNYTTWTQHGEIDDHPMVNPILDMGGPSSSSNQYRNLVMDAAGYGYDWDHDSDDEDIEEPNPHAQIFYDLLKDADERLWDGCDVSKLSTMTQLLHIKSTYGIPNKGFEAILRLMKGVLPKDEKLPESYYKMKQILRKHGLGYKKIHACINDCVLYYVPENENRRQCPTCGHPRYKPNNGQSTSKEIAWKILRYFSLKPRLQRLYQSSKTAEHMRWHSDTRIEAPDEIRHPADSEAWKDFDSNILHLHLKFVTLDLV